MGLDRVNLASDITRSMLRWLVFSAILGVAVALPRRLPRHGSALYPHLGLVRPAFSHTFGRIIGGTLANDFQFPFIAALYFEVTPESAVTPDTKPGMYFCGASIINSLTLVTAGHCVVDAASVKIIAGTNKWREASNETEIAKGAVVRDAIFFKSHEDYDYASIAQDIGFLKVDINDPLPVGVPNSNGDIPIDTIELADNEAPAGSTVTEIGWGATSFFGDVSEELRFTETTVVDDDDTGSLDSQDRKDQFVCTQSSPPHGTCGGDSGGPIVDQDGKLFGATSYGNIICAFGPSCFSSTVHWRPWLKENAGI